MSRRCCGVAVRVLTGSHSRCWGRQQRSASLARTSEGADGPCLSCSWGHSFGVNNRSLLLLQSWGGGWWKWSLRWLHVPWPERRFSCALSVAEHLINCTAAACPPAAAQGKSLQRRRLLHRFIKTSLTNWRCVYKTYRLCTFCTVSWSLKSGSAVKVVLFVLFYFIVTFFVVTSPFLSLFISRDFVTALDIMGFGCSTCSMLWALTYE